MTKPKARPRHRAPSKTARRIRSAAIWAGSLAVIGGSFFALANTSGIAYGERQLAIIDFSSLTDAQKRAALVEANADRCTCGCGMTLAQCVATDMTCPVRESNVTKIRGMVQRAQNQ